MRKDEVHLIKVKSELDYIVLCAIDEVKHREGHATRIIDAIKPILQARDNILEMLERKKK